MLGMSVLDPQFASHGRYLPASGMDGETARAGRIIPAPTVFLMALHGVANAFDSRRTRVPQEGGGSYDLYDTRSGAYVGQVRGNIFPPGNDGLPSDLPPYEDPPSYPEALHRDTARSVNQRGSLSSSFWKGQIGSIGCLEPWHANRLLEDGDGEVVQELIDSLMASHASPIVINQLGHIKFLIAWQENSAVSGQLQDAMKALGGLTATLGALDALNPYVDRVCQRLKSTGSISTIRGLSEGAAALCRKRGDGAIRYFFKDAEVDALDRFNTGIFSHPLTSENPRIAKHLDRAASLLDRLSHLKGDVVRGGPGAVKAASLIQKHMLEWHKGSYLTTHSVGPLRHWGGAGDKRRIAEQAIREALAAIDPAECVGTSDDIQRELENLQAMSI